MAKELKIPQFDKEADEARWWESHQPEVAAEFERAAAQGRLGHGTVARQGATPTTTIRLDPADIARAKAQAKRRVPQVSRFSRPG
jgi:hypothetical protein